MSARGPTAGLGVADARWWPASTGLSSVHRRRLCLDDEAFDGTAQIGAAKLAAIYRCSPSADKARTFDGPVSPPKWRRDVAPEHTVTEGVFARQGTRETPCRRTPVLHVDGQQNYMSTDTSPPCRGSARDGGHLLDCSAVTAVTPVQRSRRSAACWQFAAQL